MSIAAPQHRPLGQILIAEGILSEDQLRIALLEQMKLNQPIGKLLVSLGFVSEATLRQALSETLGKQSIDLKHAVIDPQALKLIPREVAKRYHLLPLDYNTRKSIDHTQGGLTYEHRFGEQLVQLSAYVGQRSTIQYQSIPKSVQQSSIKQSGGIIDFDRDFAGGSARWIGRFQLAGGKLTTTVGVDYEQSTDDRRGYENFIGTTLGVKGTLRRLEEDRVSSFDQYAQAEWQGERWTFSGGVRHSHVDFNVDDRYLSNGNDSGSVSYDKTTPTVAAMYRLTPAVNLYASAARGFEAPTFNEMFYSS